ncbi:MAG: sigma-70 family RNA polymerase sigma factor [Planctomycetota bacterium]
MSHSDDSDYQALASAESKEDAFADAFERFRDRLERAVDLRMDRRVRARVDPSDVVQESYFECARRIGEFLENRPAPLFLWVRYLVLQRLLQLHRMHLGRAVRDAGREVPIERLAYPGASSRVLAAHLIASQTSPSGAAVREEVRASVEAALEDMGDMDREILVLRHFEQMSSAEAGQVLGIEHSAARKRYFRALKRLRSVLEPPPGETEGAGD